MSSEAPTTPIPPAQEAPGDSGLSRVWRVFTQPTAVFTELAATPTWLAPLVLILLLSVGMQLVIGPRLDMAGTIRQSLAERTSGPKMSDEQMDRTVELGSKTAGVMRWLTPVTVPLVFLVLGGLYFIGLKAVGSTAEFKPVFATVLHANVPAAVVSSLVMAAAVLKRASFTAQELEGMVKSSLGALLPDTAPKPLVALAGLIDVFNIWQWILLAIGLAIVGRVSRGKVIAILVVIWGVWGLGKMGLAFLQ
jgi:hypothetical protein